MSRSDSRRIKGNNMLNKKSKKIKDWSTKDVVLNVFTYVFNLAVISALFVAIQYLQGGMIGNPLETMLQQIETPLHFFILLALTIVVMAIYFFYEDRNFLKSAANSEMLFLILEISLVACFASGEYANVYLRPLSAVALLTLFLTNRSSISVARMRSIMN